MMQNTMTYKGYVGSIEFSEEDCLLFGKVQGIRSLISYEGTDGKELVAGFHSAIDNYLRGCEERGEEPEVAYKGSFNVRTSPETHRKAVIYAFNHGESLNRFVCEALEEKLAEG
ncbi:MAG: type II toxin-antitoxin system HicB family antitoxin [Olegusella sp.]|nr:type II toxin-antitoxin system HicB family antitoxin [Olegusella sp.]